MLGLSRVVRDEAEGKLFGKEDLPCFAKQMNGLGNTLLILGNTLLILGNTLLILASYSAFGTGRICTKNEGQVPVSQILALYIANFQHVSIILRQPPVPQPNVR